MPENTELNAEPTTVEESAAKIAEKVTGVENGTAAGESPPVASSEAEVTHPSYELSKFKLTRILQNNTMRKTIALLGSFPDVSTVDVAVVLLEKQAFKERDVQTASEEGATETPSIFSAALQVHTEFINNIYGSFRCIPSTELNGIKTTVVYPATEKHIEKYSLTQKYLITETPALYEQLTLPYITNSQFSLDWVYNILEHRQETDRIVYEDSDPETGFILLPDLKWDGKTLETLYLLAITRKRDIKSLRDLNSTHLPLLRNLRAGIAEAIEKRYGLCASQLRIYFHYQPSFYHLHAHINPVRGDAPGIWCEKSHMLDIVISNIELMSDYYQRVTLPFVLFEDSKLLDAYEAQKAVQKCAKIVENGIEKNEDKEQCNADAVDEPQAKKLKLAADEANAEEPPERKLKETPTIEVAVE
ncbi:PREDICTED: m7GpppX diphosphatase [Rhagoletis zephyria]|uniref:m7GpppX diphosphatase n=1 Tax=Rhagoletis zephyria TaxID=28612 RepID=UPI000811A289|nr:PREDICTED: m7GpppX diphosphatase [Rhagoletis zephyria]